MTGDDARPSRPRAVHAAIGAAIVAVAFLYQFAHPSFPNDHFDHLAKARQVVHGEYPVRDFLDPGRPLTIGLSAVALRLSADTLLGEAVLTAGAIAKELGLPEAKVKKAIKDLALQPKAKRGVCNLYGRDVLPKVKSAAAK